MSTDYPGRPNRSPIQFKGQTVFINELAAQYDLSYDTIRHRYHVQKRRDDDLVKPTRNYTISSQSQDVQARAELRDYLRATIRENTDPSASLHAAELLYKLIMETEDRKVK